MKKLTIIFGILILSLTARAWQEDLKVFTKLESVGVSTNLSASSKSKIMAISSIECRTSTNECLVDDASNYGFQRTISGDDAISVLDLLTSVFHARPVFEGSDLYVVTDLRCVQLKKEGVSLDQQTACYSKVMVNYSNLTWRNPLTFNKIASEK